MKAYGAITITDLSDTTTQIYYAEEVTTDGVLGVSLVPNQATKFIGFYEGEPGPLKNLFIPKNASGGTNISYEAKDGTITRTGVVGSTSSYLTDIDKEEGYFHLHLDDKESYYASIFNKNYEGVTFSNSNFKPAILLWPDDVLELPDKDNAKQHGHYIFEGKRYKYDSESQILKELHKSEYKKGRVVAIVAMIETRAVPLSFVTISYDKDDYFSYNIQIEAGTSPTSWMVPPCYSPKTRWSKYVGEGKPGVGISSTTIEYAVSDDGTTPPSNGWTDQTNLPIARPGQYFWVRTTTYYTDGTNSVSYSVSRQGIDGSRYYTSTNSKELLFFIEGNRLVSTPQFLSFGVYNDISMKATSQVDLTDGQYKLEYRPSPEEDFVELPSIEKKYVQFGKTLSNDEEETIVDTNTLYFNIEPLLSHEQDGPNSIFSNLNKSTMQIRFSWYLEGDLQALEVVSVKFGTAKNMAQFSQTATSINAAIANSLMRFEQTGLKIYGTGLEIYSNLESNSPSFYADNGGNLHLVGTINATQGGTIGGFNINQNSLTSMALQADGSPNISLNGADGTAHIRNLVIGQGATIESYIQLGAAQIKNPTDEDKRFIICGETQDKQIILESDGDARFGLIGFKGAESELYGTNWSIKPDRASFSNISVSGAIETSIFKVGTTQAVGSSMIFLPAYKVEKIIKITGSDRRDVVFEETPLIYRGWKVFVISKTKKTIIQDGSEREIEETTTSCHEVANKPGDFGTAPDSKRKIRLEASSDGEPVPDGAVSVLVIGDPDDKPMIFGVNSSNVKTAGDYIFERGLTINTYSNTGLPNLFLGDLSVLNNINSLNNVFSGYGLYSDNVYLNGSLTTKTSSGGYAGINTSSLCPATIFEGSFDDISNIVIWAGAASRENVSIKNAPFQVTENGSVYAKNAKIDSSLFIDGEIRGADIYAARIHGDDTNGALTIYDTNKGIVFKKDYNKDTKDGVHTFSIKSNKFSTDKLDFITISNEKEVSFCGNVLKTSGTDNYLELKTNETTKAPMLYHHHSEQQGCGFYFEEGKTSFKMKSDDIETSKIEITGTDVILYNQISLFKSSKNKGLQYKPVTNGYDLYITG